MSRPNTPDEVTELGMRMTVKRACDRCGRELGDANPAEIAAGIAGQPLPSVIAECGCLIADAVIDALRDHLTVSLIPFPEPHWECDCGAPLAGEYISVALSTHQALLARDAVRFALTTLESE